MSLLNVLPVIGDIAGALIGQSSAKSANRTNIMLQREQRDWQERMSNTEIQRRVKDLQEAGLNPMLAYQNSASTPNVAPAEVQPTGGSWSNLGSKIATSRQVSAAVDLARANVQNVQAGTAVQVANAKNIEADTRLKEATALQVAEQTNATIKSIDKMEWEIDSIQKDVKGKTLDNEQKERANALALELMALEIAAASMTNEQLKQQTLAKTAGWRQKLASWGIQLPEISLPIIGGARK